jgi:hypothetical protein
VIPPANFSEYEADKILHRAIVNLNSLDDNLNVF